MLVLQLHLPWVGDPFTLLDSLTSIERLYCWTAGHPNILHLSFALTLMEQILYMTHFLNIGKTSYPFSQNFCTIPSMPSTFSAVKHNMTSIPRLCTWIE